MSEVHVPGCGMVVVVLSVRAGFSAQVLLPILVIAIAVGREELFKETQTTQQCLPKKPPT